MLLTLRILSYRNQPVPTAPPVRFSEAGGTIGRSTDNALVLDDPSKFISRMHARVSARDGVFLLDDVGSNASVVNDRPLDKGTPRILAHGDRIAIGDYQLQVQVDMAAAMPPLAPAPQNDPALPLFEPPAPVAPVQLLPLDFPFGDGAAPKPAAEPQSERYFDPLAVASILQTGGEQDTCNTGFDASDPLGLNAFGAPPAPARAADSDHVSPELAAFSLPARPPAPPGAAAAPPQFAPPSVSGGFAIPADYDPLADFFAPAVVPVATPSATIAPAPAPAPAAPDATVFAHEPAAQAAWTPPAPVASSVPTPASATALSPAANPGDDAVLQALLRGLGLPNLQLQRPATEVAELVGAMLREATAGTMDVLMARALTKKESRIDMTMLSVRANNPLKFFPNAEGALTQMLTGAMAGYMPPVEAMAGAFDDLRAHELAVIAGMRAALGAVLHRFDPQKIEARLALPTVMDKMLSSNRKAKMWDRLVELYGEIAREADDDLQRLFGEKFSEAYEEQVERLRRAKQ